MRVVVTCVPQSGHIYPLLPLADAFHAQGDEVVFASGEDAEALAVERGLDFRRVGPPFAAWYERLRARTRGIPGDGLPPDRVEHYFLPRLFGEVGAAAMIDDLVSLCTDVRADLLVFDPLVFAGPLAAAAVGIAGVQHTIGPLLEPDVGQLVTDVVSPLWREFELDVPPDAGMYAGATVTICPVSLDPAAAERPRVRQLRPVPPPVAGGARPAVLPEDGPTVYVTLGTFSNNPSLFALLLEAIASEPARFLFTVGRDVDPADLGAIPDNVRVERFVPQADVLPHCDAAMHHAGAGTTFGVLAHGLPSVVIPQSADNFRIAARVERAGAGKVVMPDRCDAETIRDALRTVLAADDLRAAAESLAREIAAMPSPEEVAEALRQSAA